MTLIMVDEEFAQHSVSKWKKMCVYDFFLATPIVAHEGDAG